MIFEIMITILFLVWVCLNAYFSAREKIKEYAQVAINYAEDFEKNGEEKMKIAIAQAKDIIPRIIRFAFSDDKIRMIIQQVFDKMEEYAVKQLNKKGNIGGN